MLDIDELNRKCVAGDNTFKSDEGHNDLTKYEKLEMKIEQILEDNKKLNFAVSSLSSTNHVLEKEILELKAKMKSLEKQSSISGTTSIQLKESCSADDGDDDDDAGDDDADDDDADDDDDAGDDEDGDDDADDDADDEDDAGDEG